MSGNPNRGSGFNPVAAFIAQTDSTLRKVRTDKQGREIKWAFVKISEEPVDSRALVGAPAGAPLRVGQGYAAVWVGEGEPDCEPDFPEPIVVGKLTWAFVPKTRLTDPEKNQVKQALDLLEYDEFTPTRENDTHVAVWMHDELEPTEEPTWP